MLLSRVEKPPVAIVENEWQMASKRFIGPAHKRSVRMTLSNMYTPHKLLAVWLIRGRILSCVMPVTSALNNWIPLFLLSIGMTARVKRMIPIPPMKWVMALHSKIPFGNDSTEEKVELPVVVSPDMVSK